MAMRVQLVRLTQSTGPAPPPQASWNSCAGLTDRQPTGQSSLKPGQQYSITFFLKIRAGALPCREEAVLHHKPKLTPPHTTTHTNNAHNKTPHPQHLGEEPMEPRVEIDAWTEVR
jgi:hypothetical protein